MMALLFSALGTIVPFGSVQAATLWSQTYGGSNNDRAYSLVETSDGGYAIAGTTESVLFKQDDFWLVKTDADGTISWSQTYGGSEYDAAFSLVEANDGGYALTGYSGYDVWLVPAGHPVYVRLAWILRAVGCRAPVPAH
ncbi:MAG: hypothetical protein P8X48_10600 [Acidiferrobacteraceae bacterium]